MVSPLNENYLSVGKPFQCHCELFAKQSFDCFRRYAPRNDTGVFRHYLLYQ